VRAQVRLRTWSEWRDVAAAALTPYQRVLAAGVLSPEQQQGLAREFQALDPIRLARDIQQTLDVLWKLADTRHRPQEAARG
jgi:hypothetical protein